MGVVAERRDDTYVSSVLSSVGPRISYSKINAYFSYHDALLKSYCMSNFDYFWGCNKKKGEKTSSMRHRNNQI